MPLKNNLPHCIFKSFKTFGEDKTKCFNDRSL